MYVDKIIKEATALQEKTYSSVITNLGNTITDFIISNNRVLYGDKAYELLINHLGGKNETIFCEQKNPSDKLKGITSGLCDNIVHTFYSPDSIGDREILVEKLKNTIDINGYNSYFPDGIYSKKDTELNIIIRINQIGPLVYIRFIPHIFNEIYTHSREIEIGDGKKINVLDEKFQCLQYLSILTNPIEHVDAWYLSMKRLGTFLKYIEEANVKEIINIEGGGEENRINLKNILLHIDKNLIFIGIDAIGGTSNTLEFLTYIPNIIDNEFKNPKLKIKFITFHRGQIDFIQGLWIYKYNNMTVKMYSIRDMCIPHKNNYASYLVTFKYILINLWFETHNIGDKEYQKSLLNKLIKTKQFDPQELKYGCDGNMDNEYIRLKKSLWDKKRQNIEWFD